MSELQVGDQVQTGTDIKTFQMTSKCLLQLQLYYCDTIQNDYLLAMKVLTNGVIFSPVTN